MELLCHRCGTTLVPDDTFCTTCGAPQLRIEQGAEGVEPFNSSSPRYADSHPADPSWKDAILSALIFAVPVGLLSSSLLPFAAGGSCLWVMSGAVAAVNLYHRRSTEALLDTRVGLRIGMIVGLTAALLASTIDGLMMVVQRYVRHNPAGPDKLVQDIIEAMMAPYAQNPQAQAQLHDFFAINTPEGKAALVLFYAMTSSLAVFVFSIVGGALGAKIFGIRKMRVRNP